jgi:hypothetical protein
MTQTLAVLFLVSPLQVEKTKRKEASQTASGGQHQMQLYKPHRTASQSRAHSLTHLHDNEMETRSPKSLT